MLQYRVKELRHRGYNPPTRKCCDYPCVATAAARADEASALLGRGGLPWIIARRVLAFARGPTHMEVTRSIVHAALVTVTKAAIQPCVTPDQREAAAAATKATATRLLNSPLRGTELVDALEVLSSCRIPKGTFDVTG